MTRDTRAGTGPAARDHDSRVPPRRAAVGGRTQRLSRDPAALDQPRGQRVRVPHLARVELIAPPDRRGHLAHQVEHPLGEAGIRGQPPRTAGRLGHIRDHPVAPSADLIPEDPESPGPARADGASADDSPGAPVARGDRSHLDDVSVIGDVDLERGVEEGVTRAPLQPRGHGLEHEPVQAHGMADRAQRKPVEEHARGRPFRHRAGRVETLAGSSTLRLRRLRRSSQADSAARSHSAVGWRAPSRRR